MSKGSYIPRIGADVLARLHYGIPLPGRQKRRGSSGHASILTRLRQLGHVDGHKVTEQGYRYLREAIRKMELEKNNE